MTRKRTLIVGLTALIALAVVLVLSRTEARPRTAVMTDAGELVRTEMDDGSRLEPASPEAILRLWQRKGLPAGTLSRDR